MTMCLRSQGIGFVICHIHYRPPLIIQTDGWHKEILVIVT